MKIELSDNEKILVVAPHPDDESIGCGGLLNKFRGKCDVLLVTNGHLNKPENKQIIEIRQQEFESAIKTSKVNEVFYLQIFAQEIPKCFDRFLSIDYSKYKYIFVPNRFEIVQDHVDVYSSIKKALKKKNIKTNLLEYEVWTTIRFPNVYLDITDVIELKKAAIEQHKSQTSELDFVKLITGLNAYRGLSKGFDFAEAFYCEAEKRREQIRHIKRKIKRK